MQPVWILFCISAGAMLGGTALLLARWFIVGYDESKRNVHTKALYAVTIGSMALGGGYAIRLTDDLRTVIAVLIITALLLIVALVDYATRRIPNEMILALLGWALVQAIWLRHPSLRTALAGFLAGGVSFYLLALLGRGALGMGDVKLAAALGAILGFPAVFYALFWGVLLGGLAALFLLLSRRAGLKSSFAYGPYLAMGAWLTYLSIFHLLPWQ